MQVAKKLGLHTLIEGLEDTDQLSFVRGIECELAQGYLFHRPEPIESTFYRLDSGQPPRPCETLEERERQIKEWFDVSPGVLKSLLTHVLESRQDPLAYFQR